jgi:hypothetical protein
MTNLPAKPPATEPAESEIADVPGWRELRERTSDVLKELVREGKELERELEPRLLPALRRLKAQIEKLIAKLEGRVTERERTIEPGP